MSYRILTSKDVFFQLMIIVPIKFELFFHKPFPDNLFLYIIIIIRNQILIERINWPPESTLTPNPRDAASHLNN